MKVLRATLALLSVLCGATPAAELVSPRFTPIPGIRDSHSFIRVEGVSADGQVVVGAIDSDVVFRGDSVFSGESYLYAEPFRWTEQEGMIRLGHPFDEDRVIELSNWLDLNDHLYSEATAVSADGSSVAGWGGASFEYWDFQDWESGNPNEYELVETHHLFFTSLWPAGTPLSPPTEPGDWGDGMFVTDISANGSRITGSHGRRALLWSRHDSGGIAEWRAQELGSLAPSDHSSAHAISADGEVVVGTSGARPFRWTPAAGMEALESEWGWAEASGVSADGRVMVGQRRSSPFYEAVYWNADGRVHQLPDLPDGDSTSSASDASGDGKLVVGRGTSDSGPEAVLWDENRAVRSIREILEEGGVDLTGWTLTNAVAISDDGTVVVGNGRNPDGIEQGWIAHLGASRIAPIITQLAPTADPGRFVLHYRASADDQRTLQFSEDLRTWADVGSVPLSAGENVLTVSAPANTPEGYWRLGQP